MGLKALVRQAKGDVENGIECHAIVHGTEQKPGIPPSAYRGTLISSGRPKPFQATLHGEAHATSGMGV